MNDKSSDGPRRPRPNPGRKPPGADRSYGKSGKPGASAKPKPRPRHAESRQGRAEESRPRRDGGPSRPSADTGRGFAGSGGGRAKAPAGFHKERPRPQRPETEAAPAADEARIAKVMARAGLCSRRDAEEWIAAGRVAINGVVLTTPGVKVTDGDRVLVDGQPLPARERTRLFLFHKPRGLVTTDRDPEGRPTIFSALPEDLPRLVTVGRLDINTEGLLLLTNDGGLARLLELPSTGWLRRYRVRANGETDQGVLDGLHGGITIDGIEYAGIDATLDRVQGANVWLTMGLREGKNREVKRVLEHLGLTVNRLIRLSFGPFQLGALAEGAVEEVRARVIQDQLGPELAQAAGLDFDSPVAAARAAEPDRRPEREARGDRRPARSGARDSDQPRSRPPARGADKRPGRFPAARDAERLSTRDPRRGGAAGRFGDRPERRSDRRAEEPEPKPRVVKPKPGPRRHISVLRAEQRSEEAAARVRVERSETADRKGRAVAVERRQRSGAAATEAGGAKARPPRQRFGDDTRARSSGPRASADREQSDKRAPYGGRRSPGTEKRDRSPGPRAGSDRQQGDKRAPYAGRPGPGADKRARFSSPRTGSDREPGDKRRPPAGRAGAGDDKRGRFAAPKGAGERGRGDRERPAGRPNGGDRPRSGSKPPGGGPRQGR